MKNDAERPSSHTADMNATHSKETPIGGCVKRLVRRPVAFILELIYGVRGSLKPPLGGPNAGALYPLRYRWWRATNALYGWSGLPDRWYAWRTSPNDQGQR